MTYPDDDYGNDGRQTGDARAAEPSKKKGITKSQLIEMMRNIASEEVDDSVTPISTSVDYLLKKSAEIQSDPLNDVKRKAAERAMSSGSKTSEFKALVLGFVMIIIMFIVLLFAPIDVAIRANYIDSVIELAKWYLGVLGTFILGRNFIKGKSVGSLGAVGNILGSALGKNKISN